MEEVEKWVAGSTYLSLVQASSKRCRLLVEMFTIEKGKSFLSALRNLGPGNNYSLIDKGGGSYKLTAHSTSLISYRTSLFCEIVSATLLGHLFDH